jgi:hypothetical protein
MSGENSYLSRFFVKFVEVSAAGLATAVSDAPVAQPARKAVKDAKALPPRKQTKTPTGLTA